MTPHWEEKLVFSVAMGDGTWRGLEEEKNLSFIMSSCYRSGGQRVRPLLRSESSRFSADRFAEGTWEGGGRRFDVGDGDPFAST